MICIGTMSIINASNVANPSVVMPLVVAEARGSPNRALESTEIKKIKQLKNTTCCKSEMQMCIRNI